MGTSAIVDGYDQLRALDLTMGMVGLAHTALRMST